MEFERFGFIFGHALVGAPENIVVSAATTSKVYCDLNHIDFILAMNLKADFGTLGMIEHTTHETLET